MERSMMEQEDSINFRRYFQIASQHIKIGIIVVLSITLLSYYYGKIQPEKYRTTFNLYYNNENNYHTDEWNRMQAIGNDKKTFWIKTMQSNKLYELVGEYSGLKYSIDHTRSLFSVSQDKTENIYEVSLTVRSPEVIESLVDGFIHAINSIDRFHQNDLYINKVNYLNKLLFEKEKKLDSIDVQIMKLGSLLNLGNIENLDQVKEIAENFRVQLKNTEVELSYVQASLQKTQSSLTSLNDTLFEKSSFTEPLKVQLMNLHVDLARALTKYGEEHPVVLGIRDNITHVKKMLTDGFEQNIEIKNIKANPIKRKLLGQLIDLRIQEISLQSKIKSLRNIFNTSNTINSPNQNLYHLLKKREPLINTIDFLNKKIITTEMLMKGISDSFFLVDRPHIPSVPNNKTAGYYILLGLLLGLMLATVLIVIYDYIDDRIKLVEDFGKFFTLPIIGAIRHRDPKNILKRLTKSPEEAYQEFENELTDIRINLNQLITKAAKNLFSISSPTRKDGKTLILYLLSMEFAKAGKKVALLDFDIYLPQLSKLFSCEKKTGIQDFIFSDAGFTEIITSTGIPNLDIIPIGKNPYNVKLLFDTLKVDELLSKVSQNYDIVLIDTPALLLAPQMLELLKKIDINIIVTRIGHSSRRNIELFLSKLDHIPTKLLGTILTDVKPVPLGSYYDAYARYDYYKYYPKQRKKRRKSKSKKRSKKRTSMVKRTLLIVGVILSLVVNLAPILKRYLEGFNEQKILQLNQEIRKSSNAQHMAHDNLQFIRTAQNRENPVNTDQPENRQFISHAESEIAPHEFKPYHIIAGSFSSEANANRLTEKLKELGYPKVRIIETDRLYIVSILSFSKKSEAISNIKHIQTILNEKVWVYHEE